MVGDGFDHEVRTVGNVSVRAEEHGADADGDDEAVEPRIAEQARDFDLVSADIPGGKLGGVIFLEGQKSPPDFLRVFAGELGEVSAVGLDEVLHLDDDVGVTKWPEMVLRKQR